MDREELDKLLEGTGKVIYNFNCLSCGKYCTNSNSKNVLRKRLNTVGYENFLLCRPCAIKKGCKNRTAEDKQKSLEKRKQTCLEKYGVDNPFKDKEKIKDAYLSKLGVENPSQLKKVKEKKKQTTRDHFGVDNPLQSSEVQEKVKRSMLKKYGTTVASKSKIVVDKTRKSNLKKYGVEYPSQLESRKTHLKEIWEDKKKRNELANKVSKTWLQKTDEELRDIRIKSYSPYEYDGLNFDSSWELAVWIWAKDNGKSIKREPVCIEYKDGEVVRKYYPDFEIEGKLVEVKGDHFFNNDGKMICPFDRSLDDRFEAKHQAGLKAGVEIWTDDAMAPILDYVNQKYTKDYLSLFRKNTPFPEEEFTSEGDLSLIRYYHKSLNWASRKGKLSPLQAWGDKNLVKKSALNRLKYVGSCSPKNIIRGFSIAQIAPRVSVFKPSVASNLISKYLSDVDIIYDPFSGFSGRMLGAFNCGKQYFGFDINEAHVRESNEIIDYKKIGDMCSVEVRDLITTPPKDYTCLRGTCLFTCPPYGGKEHWNENNDEVEKSCDEWIDLCIEKYKVGKYLFVVDKTEKYKDNVVEELKTKSHLGERKELVILIEG